MALSGATGSYGAWGVGLWDTPTWGPDVVWVDVSQYVRRWSTNRRFSRDLQGWEPGTAIIELDNRDARFSPSNLTGPYVTAGVTMIRPWRPVRIRCTFAGVTYDVFTGYVIDWQESWYQQSPNAGGAIQTVGCVDELGSLARFDGIAQASVGAGESTGQRVIRILNNAGHIGMRDVDNGTKTMQATVLDKNAAEDLKLTADSEGGAVYINRAGTVVFDSMYALIENTRSNTIQATFDDTTAGLAYNDIASDYNGELVNNIVSFQRVGGAVMTSSDSTSRALYGDKRHARTDLMSETDTQVQGIADLWLQRFRNPELRLTRIKLKPRFAPTRMFPVVLGREVRDLIRVSKRPPGGITITQDVFITGIAHTCEGDDWVTTFQLWSGLPYTTFTSSRFGTGLWGTATWFY
jgi:hypothetical protein